MPKNMTSARIYPNGSSKLSVLWPFVFVLVLAPVLLSSAASKSSPNIVFILADDLGYMDIGANNPKTFYETPNIDGLARKGMRFTQAYAACCVCSPTRASIMTGKYPARIHLTDYLGGQRAGKLNPAPYENHLAPEEVTIAQRLRDAGYTNFFAGKWHLGVGQFSPNTFGFGPGLVGTNQFYYPAGNIPSPKDPIDPKTTDYIADQAVRFIQENGSRPFFAYLPFQAVHIPIGARADLIAKYRQKALTAPPDAWGEEGETKVRLVQNHAKYAAMLEQMDSAIGRVLEALKRYGVADRTIVIFMSDNGGLSTAEGWSTSNLPLRGGKGWPYEGGIREPLIICAPGVTKPASLCDTPVISNDFYPTLLDLAGLPPMPQQHRDGVSLLRLLQGRKLPRRDLFWHYPHYGNQGGSPCSTIRDGDWKLIEWFEDQRLELFNLKSDLSESKNVAPANPGKVKKLHARLVAWRKDVNALLPTPNTSHSSSLPSGAHFAVITGPSPED